MVTKWKCQWRDGWVNQEFGISIYMYTTMYKIDNQEGPTIQKKELYLIFCNNLYGI